MKKLNQFILLIVCSTFTTLSLHANPGDTTWVQANQVQLNYYNNFDDTVVFPDNSVTYRKILMYFDLGKYNCSSSEQYCHQWDYTVHNYLINNGDTVELNRLITPYATSGWDRFNGNWVQPYVFDVTEFEPMLHDSSVIRILYSGYSGGFTADIKFAFIEGIPPRDIKGIEKVYANNKTFGNASNPINNHFPSKNYSSPIGTKSAAMRVLITGHGSDDATQCCEFASNNYRIALNGTQIVDEAIWKDDCGMNQLYPQGGTWIYDRANWCPGEKVIADYHPLTTVNTEAVNYDVQMSFNNYTGTGNLGSYNTQALIFYYGDFNKTLDVSLENIVSPTTDPNYFRENPTGTYPEVIVKNVGSSTINSIEFEFGVKDSTTQTYLWNGTINPMEEKTIALNELLTLKHMSFQGLTGEYEFQVSIKNVNGQADEDVTNNSLKSNFVVAPAWPGDLILTLYTGNLVVSNGQYFLGNPDQKWEIMDVNGNVIKSRTNTFQSQTYLDTISITTPGFYKLKISTNNGMGLHWWPWDGNSQVDQGGFDITDIDGNVIAMKNYVYNGTERDDFGDEYVQYFTIPTPGGLGINNIENENNRIKVFPNPAKDYIQVTSSKSNGICKVELINMMGQVVYQDTNDNPNFYISTANLDAGMYTLLFQNGTHRSSKKVIITK